MKILMITNKVKTYALGFKNVIEPLLELGHELVWAADFSKFVGNLEDINCKIIQIPINSNPLKLCNYKAYKKVLNIIDEEKIEAIYCATPIGGTIGRLAGKKKKIKPVIYAAHGFLYHKNSSKLRKFIFRSHEKLLSKHTDIFITITKEDYDEAVKFKLRKNGKLFLIHGAGVEVGKQVLINKEQKRSEFGIHSNAKVIVSAGFLNKNKNNKVVVNALGKLQNKNVYYVVCGEGSELDNLKKLTKKYKLEDNIIFAGFRTDIAEVMAMSDIFVMPSFREGVPRSLLEAMDLGLPCIGARTRGLTEIIVDGVGGYVCHPKKPNEFATAIDKLVNNSNDFGTRNKEEVKKYSKECVIEELTNIFKENL